MSSGLSGIRASSRRVRVWTGRGSSKVKQIWSAGPMAAPSLQRGAEAGKFAPRRWLLVRRRPKSRRVIRLQQRNLRNSSAAALRAVRARGRETGPVQRPSSYSSGSSEEGVEKTLRARASETTSGRAHRLARRGRHRPELAAGGGRAGASPTVSLRRDTQRAARAVLENGSDSRHAASPGPR